MDIRGILLANSEQNIAGTQALDAPLATLDVAGKSTLQRMAERLQQYGISSVSAVVEASIQPKRSQFWSSLRCYLRRCSSRPILENS